MNREVATSFPVDEAIPERKPGVYVLTATTANSESYDTRATQWFVVSDIGLSTLTGQDGLHAGDTVLLPPAQAGQRVRAAAPQQER